MRHRIDRRKLNMKGAHLRSMLANMAVSLIMHESIRTTVPRAKELRRYIEPLVTLARKQTLDAKRRVSACLHQQREPVHKMFDDIAKRFVDRPGGYVRVIKAGTRPGDDAEMAVIQFVDYPELLAKREAEEAEKGADDQAPAEDAEAVSK